MSYLNRRTALSAALSLAMPAIWAQGVEFQKEPQMVFTDSSPEKLGKTRKVVIASVVLEFQTQVSAEDLTGFLGQRVLNRQNTYSQNTLAGFNVAALRFVADRVYDSLQQDLKKAGFEVLPHSVLSAHPTYQTLTTEMAHVQGGHWGNEDGNSILVSPNSLPLYVPNAGEAGTFSNHKKQVAPFQGPANNFDFKRASAGSYSAPREVEVAKALDAHLVKAWYLVGFGHATAETGWDSQTTRTATYGNMQVTSWKMASSQTGGTAQMYLRGEQSRIAFRTPDGDASYRRESSRRGTLGGSRPYDGDVVLRLDEMVLGAASILAPGGGVQQVSSQPTQAGGVLGGLFGAVPQAAGTTRAAYVTQVDALKFAEASRELITSVQSRMVAKLKP